MKYLAWLALFGACISLFLFPRPLTVLLALLSAPVIPFAPFLVGAFADALYLPPGLHAIPLLTLAGAGASLLALFVRSRLTAGIIG